MYIQSLGSSMRILIFDLIVQHSGSTDRSDVGSRIRIVVISNY